MVDQESEHDEQRDGDDSNDFGRVALADRQVAQIDQQSELGQKLEQARGSEDGCLVAAACEDG